MEHAQLTNKATHNDKTRVFRLGSYTEHLQSRPEGKVNSSIYYKILGNTKDCKVDESALRGKKGTVSWNHCFPIGQHMIVTVHGSKGPINGPGTRAVCTG